MSAIKVQPAMVFGGIAVLLCLTGCAQLRLPAIDPTGERLFLPAPNYTTVAPERVGIKRFGWPRPAYVAPPPPPPCQTSPPAAASSRAVQPQTRDLATNPPAMSATPLNPRSPTIKPCVYGGGRFNARLVLNPTRMVAPVGGEIVLRAGLCNEDGFFLTKQPIEWMLSRDSVGTFVSLDDHETWLARLTHRKPNKESGDFARGWTSSVHQIITRGTPQTDDDISLVQGQTWISLTSGSEGVSIITAMAPSAASWDQRRQTARIHWIDGQWTFPPPAISRSGQPQTLTTTVRRSTNGAPIEGWIVRYEIVSGVAAALDLNGARIKEVVSDTSGRAPVVVMPQVGEPGVTQLRITIVRPSQSSTDLPRMVVGQGSTSVTWSRPGLSVRITGPAAGEPEAELSYRVEISNPGDVAASDLEVNCQVPFGLDYMDSNPAGQIFGNRVQWQIEELAPYERRVLEVRFRATRTGEVRICATARSADGLMREACTTTSVARKSLSIDVQSPEADEIRVGDRVQFRITVTNTGDLPLSNILITDRFDEGLRHFDPNAPDAVTPGREIQRALPTPDSSGVLQPGQSSRFAVTFIAERPGRLCNTIEAHSSEGISESVESCIDVLPAVSGPAEDQGAATQPSGPAGDADLRVQHIVVGDASPRRMVGELIVYEISVENRGQSSLTNVEVTEEFETGLALAQAQFEPTRRDNGKLVWIFPSILPGQKASIRIDFRCTQPSARACARVTVTAEQGATRTDGHCLEILPSTRPGPDTGPGTFPNGPRNGAAAQEANGRLEVSVSSVGNPATVGDEVTFYVTIVNNSAVADEDVELTVTLPEGTGSVSSTPPPGTRYERQPSDRFVFFSPIRGIRSGETVEIPIRVTLENPGTVTMSAEVNSRRSPKPITASEQIRVFRGNTP